MALHLEIVTPRGLVAEVDADEVVLPGKLGEFGVLEGHIPFLSSLKSGVLRYRAKTEWHYLAIGNGFAEVNNHRKVLVLTDTHASPREITLEDVRQELHDLEEKIKAWAGEVEDAHYQELLTQAAWAQARLEAKTIAHAS